MIRDASALGRTALRMAAALAGAIVAAWLMARFGIGPARFVDPGVAVAVVTLLFWFQPAEGLGVFLLFSLVGNTLQTVLPADLRYFDEIGLLVLGAAALVRYRVPRGRLRMGVAEWAIGVVVVAGLASSFADHVPANVWVPGLLLLFKGIAFFYLVSWLPLRLEDVTRTGTVIVAAALLVVLLGAWELADTTGFHGVLGLPPYSTQRGGVQVIESVLLQPGVFGWLTVFASLCIYAWVVLARTWWPALLGLLLNVGTFFSGRRTATIALLVAVGAGIVWHLLQVRSVREVLRSWIPVAAAVAVVLLSFLPSVGGLYAETAGHYLNQSAAINKILGPNPDPALVAHVRPRTALYVGSVAIARDYFPLGAGLGRYGSYMSRLDYSPVYAQYGMNAIPNLSPANPVDIDDTFWPMVLGETGVIGFAAFAVLILTIFLRLWRSITAEDSMAWQILALGGLLIFVQGFVASATAGTYVAPPIAYFVLGSAGAVLAVRATRDDDARHEGDSVAIARLRQQLSVEQADSP